MRKFNWDEFKNKDNKIAVHCKTEEEAKDFCERCISKEWKWCIWRKLPERDELRVIQG